MPQEMQVTAVQGVKFGILGDGAAQWTVHIINGFGHLGLSATGGSANQTFTTLVGPTLAQAQFIRAIATASLASVGQSVDAGTARWNITGVDADHDDETGRVQLSVDAEVSNGANATATLESIAFQVTIIQAG
ncbi:hypothetical protein [Agromyces sp. Marseille-P2726]|uniref:hypothetical protein n=1 Tax=Agromyces sp. Marseille-P2726 TaxID=2709132 RepID=UPI00156E6E93|nr:hypothetical protein [Agromyces sp. Marseille-P2726]